MHPHRTYVTLRMVAAIAILLSSSLAATSSTSGTLAFERVDRYGYSRTFQIALGDLDGDGDLDAVFANIPQRSEVWLNDGTGTFTNAYQNIGSGARGMGMGDLDGDGDLDLVMAPASSSERSQVYLNDGAAQFTLAPHDLGDVGIPANCMSLFDAEGDGDLDAGMYYASSQRHSRLYLNDGTSRLSATDVRLPGIAVWGDIDGDGDTDAICIQHEQTGRGYKIFLNQSSTTFQEIQHIAAPSAFFAEGAQLVDVDNDGDLDLVANGGEAGESPLTILSNDGAGVFALAPASAFSCPPGRIAVGDLDGDGAVDVYVGCFERQPPRIALGDGLGGFVDAELDLGSSSYTGVAAIGDVDGDGDLDIFAPSYGTAGGPNELWMNTTRSEGVNE